MNKKELIEKISMNSGLTFRQSERALNKLKNDQNKLSKPERSDEFHNEFQKLYTALVEIAFEYVERNTDEIEMVYVLGSMEGGIYFCKSCYKINGTMVKPHKIKALLSTFDSSSEKAFNMQKECTLILQDIAALFQTATWETPTLLKLAYHTKTGKMEGKFLYGPQYTNSKTKVASDLYDEWFDELSTM